MALTSFLALPEGNEYRLYVPGLGGAEASVGAGTPYGVDTTPKYPIGTIIRRGFKTFVYCYAGGVCTTGVGVYKSKKTNACAVAPVQKTAASMAADYPGETLAAGAKGSRYVTITIDAVIGHLVTGVLWANELAGGDIVISNTTQPQQRTIVSHPALAAAGALTVKLDAPLSRACVAATTYIENMDNIFAYVKADNAGGPYVSFLGVPTDVAASGEWFWMQTYGPCWMTSNSNTCDSALDRTLVFVGNGTVVSSNDIIVEDGFQIAGFALDSSSVGASNAPMVFLTIMR